MARSNFKPAERAVFVVDAQIEWHNGSGSWHPGVILRAIERDSIGVQRVMLRHTGRTTKTVSTGQVLCGSPGNVRLPVNAS